MGTITRGFVHLVTIFAWVSVSCLCTWLAAHRSNSHCRWQGSGNSAAAVPRAIVAQARWRWSAEADGYVPDRRSAAGRAVATDLDARGGNTLARREQRRLNAEFDACN